MIYQEVIVPRIINDGSAEPRAASGDE